MPQRAIFLTRISYGNAGAGERTWHIALNPAPIPRAGQIDDYSAKSYTPIGRASRKVPTAHRSSMRRSSLLLPVEDIRPESRF